eukprot:TRINITY_DN102967_c0_g1_i1.p1 TRINITY_DN102967_c0_g1~~TRINITY_DN102967_c0_g1_i1.p1  ORF type:complete len:186 (-),score=29.39 TRINITY_DN102967_c0_g1_i1:96-653(-)
MLRFGREVRNAELGPLGSSCRGEDVHELRYFSQLADIRQEVDAYMALGRVGRLVLRWRLAGFEEELGGTMAHTLEAFEQGLVMQPNESEKDYRDRVGLLLWILADVIDGLFDQLRGINAQLTTTTYRGAHHQLYGELDELFEGVDQHCTHLINESIVGAEAHNYEARIQELRESIQQHLVDEGLI